MSGQGTFSADENGQVTFTPEVDFTGTTSIVYIVADNDGAFSNEATITVNVTDTVVSPGILSFSEPIFVGSELILPGSLTIDNTTLEFSQACSQVTGSTIVLDNNQTVLGTCDPNKIFIVLGGFGALNNPNRIVQDPSAPPHLAALEAEAITDLLERHQLPADDAPRLLGWARHDIRGLVYDKILAIIKKDSRTAAEQAVVDWLTGLVWQKQKQVAQEALDQYDAWSFDWQYARCQWQPPAGFDQWTYGTSLQ